MVMCCFVSCWRAMGLLVDRRLGFIYVYLCNILACTSGSGSQLEGGSDHVTLFIAMAIYKHGPYETNSPLRLPTILSGHSRYSSDPAS